MKKRELFIAPSLYSLFLFLVINDNWKNCDYVLARVPDIIINRLRSLFNLYVYNYPSRNVSGLFAKLFYRNKDYYNYKKVFENRKYERIWGNDEFPASFPYRDQGITLVEDGAYNEYSKCETKKRFLQNEKTYYYYWLDYNSHGYISYGWDKRITTIYHTTSIKLPAEISDKGVEIDLNNSWNLLSNERKNDILNLFGINHEFLKWFNEYDTVLLTQVLPIPDEDKIAIYKKMTEGMDMKKVLIKTHYAESTDYSKVFPESFIIKDPVPMQLFSLIGYSPKKVMTICSGATSLFLKDGVEVIFLGTEIDPRIVAKYGVMTKETYMNSLNK